VKAGKRRNYSKRACHPENSRCQKIRRQRSLLPKLSQPLPGIPNSGAAKVRLFLEKKKFMMQTVL
jgi:hypothetical protein